MRVSRILLVVVAVVAAGLAAFLALGGGFNQPPPETPTVVAEAPKTQVLVATANIGLGERLTPATLRWQDWPDSALQSGYITSRDNPDAIDKL